MLVEVDDRLIKAIKNGHKKKGYAPPRTSEEWSDLINYLLIEKIIDEYGVDVFEGVFE